MEALFAGWSWLACAFWLAAGGLLAAGHRHLRRLRDRQVRV